MLSCTVMCGCKVALLSLTENISLQPKFQLVEYFAGDAAVSKVFEEAGKAAFKYDEKYASRGLNVLTHGGFALLDCMFQAVSVCWKYMQYVFEPICCQLRCAICAALSSVPGALHLYAPVCSSWTLISSGTHERNGMNMFGNTSHEFVRDGTMMVSRWLVSALMLYVFTSSCMSVISLHVSNTVMKGLGLAADIVHCPCHHPHRAASRFVGNIQSPPSVRMGLQPSGLCLSAILPGLGFICMDHDLY